MPSARATPGSFFREGKNAPAAPGDRERHALLERLTPGCQGGTRRGLPRGTRRRQGISSRHDSPRGGKGPAQPRDGFPNLGKRARATARRFPQLGEKGPRNRETVSPIWGKCPAPPRDGFPHLGKVPRATAGPFPQLGESASRNRETVSPIWERASRDRDTVSLT
jgi:hypothetical protein